MVFTAPDCAQVVMNQFPQMERRTMDGRNLFERLPSWGVDGIITDDPARLNSMLAARGFRVPDRY